MGTGQAEIAKVDKLVAEAEAHIANEALKANPRLDALHWADGTLTRLVEEATAHPRDREIRVDAMIVYTACIELITGAQPRSIPGRVKAERIYPTAEEFDLLQGLTATYRHIREPQDISAEDMAMAADRLAALRGGAQEDVVEGRRPTTTRHNHKAAMILARLEIECDLTPEESQVLVLYLGGRMQIDSIAARLDLSRRTVLRRLKEARTKLAAIDPTNMTRRELSDLGELAPSS